MKKCTLIVAIILAFTFLGGGCMLRGSGKNESDPNVIKNECLSFLEHKYGVEFVASALQPKSWAYDYDLVCAYPKNDSSKFEGKTEESDFVRVTRTRVDNKYVFADNYLTFLLKDDYTAMIHNLAQQYFGECKVVARIENSAFPDKYISGTTLDELIKNEKVDGEISIFVKYNDNPNGIDVSVANEFAKQMLDNRLYGGIAICKMKAGKYELINEDNVNKMFDSPSDWFLDKKTGVVALDSTILKFE